MKQGENSSVRFQYLVFSHMVLLSISTIMVRVSSSDIQGLEAKCYAKIGDINIGLLLPIHGAGVGEFCGSQLYSVDRVKAVEGFVYAVNEINSRLDLLPNITLGFVVFDDCHRDVTALARSTQFVPDQNTKALMR